MMNKNSSKILAIGITAFLLLIVPFSLPVVTHAQGIGITPVLSNNNILTIVTDPSPPPSSTSTDLTPPPPTSTTDPNGITTPPASTTTDPTPPPPPASTTTDPTPPATTTDPNGATTTPPPSTTTNSTTDLNGATAPPPSSSTTDPNTPPPSTSTTSTTTSGGKRSTIKNSVSSSQAVSTNTSSTQETQICPVTPAITPNTPQNVSTNAGGQPVIPAAPLNLFGMITIGGLLFCLVKSFMTSSKIKKSQQKLDTDLKNAVHQNTQLSRSFSYQNLFKLAAGQLKGEQLNLAELNKVSAHIELLGSKEMRKISSSLHKIIFDSSKKTQLTQLIHQISLQMKREIPA